MASTYHYVPYTQVKWSHAWIGGIFAAAGIEIAKKLLAVYFGMVPTYSAVYGAFATVPILLIWIYVAWVIVLLGAVIAAYMPSLLSGLERRNLAQGGMFQLALEVLQQLYRVRTMPDKGMTLTQLSGFLRVDRLHLEPVLETLASLDWIGKLNEVSNKEEARHILLIEPETTLLEPLLHRLLLPRDFTTQRFWSQGRLATLRLREVL
jgi:membrane protein